MCIHRAPLGTHERFIGFLLEHYAGNFPVWLSPEHARVIPITDSQNEYAEQVVAQLRGQGMRVSADISAQRMNAKIRDAQLMKVPYMLVVGENEANAGQVSLRVRDGSRQDNIPLDEFIARANDRIATRSGQSCSSDDGRWTIVHDPSSIIHRPIVLTIPSTSWYHQPA